MSYKRDIREFQSFAQNFYMIRAGNVYGAAPLVTLIDHIKEIYQFVEPELITTQLVIFLDLGSSGSVIDIGQANHHRDIAYLAQDYNPRECTQDVIIGVKNNEYYIWRDAKLDLSELSKHAIVYKYSQRKDYVVLGDEYVQVPELHSSFASAFSIPTFRKLKDALEDYKHRMVVTSRCKIFAQSWSGGNDGRRLFFVPSPEAIMRNSLAQFLDITLPDAEVRPEQNMDETHPVDIKITWTATNRLALIEIKWLGKSIGADRKITQDWTASRAREGAIELAEYLEMNRTMAPIYETRGYLVVIDGRRWRLNEASVSVDRKNGLWYMNQEIDYNPKFHETRTDFEEPIRMFAEPICNVD